MVDSQGARAAAHVATQDMRAVWVSAEHQCAVWCNQVAAALGSAIITASEQLLQFADSMAIDTDAGAGPSTATVAQCQEAVAGAAAALQAAWSPEAGRGWQQGYETRARDGELGDAFWAALPSADLGDAVSCLQAPQAASLCELCCSACVSGVPAS